MTSPVARCRTILVASVSLVVALTSCGAGKDAPRSTAARTPFNADSAMSYVRQQLAFGPRVPGTAGARKTGDWIVARLRTTADTVLEQTWTATTSKGEKLPLRNIFARFRPQATERVLYVTHWDTRPFADSETDPAKQKLPIPGANDGASGVALLLAVADALKKAPPGVGVDLLFTDGEDYGKFTPDVDVLLGSAYFAEHLPSPGYKPLFGVLWDMIGDADLQIYQEANSVEAAPEVVQRVWEKAKELGYEKYVIPEVKYGPITDDHVPLIKAGLRVIDVIDIDYECHHKLCDDIDKVSAKSLGIVGDLALALVMK
jgi:glutaminyl-peptide cyclotransferase